MVRKKLKANCSSRDKTINASMVYLNYSATRVYSNYSANIVHMRYLANKVL